MATLEVIEQKEEVQYEVGGKHLLVTLKGCAINILDCEESLRALVYDATIAIGATVLQVCSHKFQPQGVTALSILAESHAILPTYPEANTILCDSFT